MFVRFTCQQASTTTWLPCSPSLSGSFASTMSHLQPGLGRGACRDASLATLATCYCCFPLFIIGCSFPFGLFVLTWCLAAGRDASSGGWSTASAWVGSSRVAHPTTYVLGRAQRWSWTRMAIAISAIMLEQTGNMDGVILAVVTMLSSGWWPSSSCSFTDEVISMKGYQVLEPRGPRSMPR